MKTANQKKTYLGLLYAMAGTFLLSTNFVTAKYGLRGFNPETFSLIWTAAAAFYSFFIIVVTREVKSLRIPSRSVGKIIGLGVVTGFGMIFTWAGLALLDPTFQAILFRFTPAINIILGTLLFGEIIRIKEIFPILILIFGGVLSCLSNWKLVYAGVILTLLAVISTSIQLFIGKERIRKINPKILVFYRAAIGTIVIAIWTFSAGKWVIHVDMSFWIVTLFGALLGPTLSFICMFQSFRYWEFYRTSIVLTVQPLIVLPLAYIFLNEIPGKMQLLGGLIILIGVLWLIFIHINNRGNLIKA